MRNEGVICQTFAANRFPVIHDSQREQGRFVTADRIPADDGSRETKSER